MKTKMYIQAVMILFVVAGFSKSLVAQSNTFPSTGRAGIYTTSPAASLQVRGGARIGTTANYINIDSATGNLSFVGTSAYRVAGNKYAFQYSGNTNYGLFFNSTNVQYEFRNGSAVPVFSVNANTGNSVFNGTLKVGAYTFPATDGANGQVLKTNGAGALTWSADNTGGSGSGWSLTGNAGTNHATNFIGTTDAQSLVFKVNNQQAGLIDYSTCCSGTRNTAFGQIALNSVGLGADNTAMGYGALYTNTSGNQNVAYGKYALFNNTANDNSAYGFNAMFFNTSGSGNTAIGITALQNNTTGSNNVAVGNYALGNNITGGNNTAIGFNAQVGVNAPLSNATAIGANTTVDISNAVVLGNNANVGIGTTSPASPLHIVSSISNNSLRVTTSGTSNDPSILLARNSGLNDKFRMNVRGNGGSSWLSIWDDTNGSPDNGINVKGNNVGIGTPSPGYVLDVAGRMRVRSGGGSPAGTWFMNAANAVDAGLVGMLNDNYIGLYGTGIGWGFIMNTTTGNVGIGTFNPTNKLSVNGTIQSKEVRVETGWSDYVFEKDYKLRSLANVAEYIAQNKHLPDIPSAKEIQDNGLAVGEVQTKMMAKIEELTLYVIELQKQVNDLKKGATPRK